MNDAFLYVESYFVRLQDYWIILSFLKSTTNTDLLSFAKMIYPIVPLGLQV